MLVLVYGLRTMSGWKAGFIPLALAILSFAVQAVLVGRGFGVSP